MLKRAARGLLGLLLTGCMATPESTAPTPPAPNVPPPTTVATASALSARAVLARASLDIRGVRPSQAELARLDADAGQLDVMIAEFLRGPAFALRVRDMFARSYRTRFEQYFLLEDFDPFSVLESQEFATEEEAEVAYEAAERFYVGFQLGAGEEALMLLGHLAAEDRPYTELLTADYTFVNEALAQVWPVAGYDAARGGWQRVTYTDERPAAGVLTTNAMYFRYVSDGFNQNRGRANALSRILVCDNYLERPIDFPRNIDLTDETGVRNAIDSNSACIGCHASLDPMASYLFGFSDGDNEDPTPFFNPENVDAWREGTGQAPAYHGQSGRDLTDLAQQILADPRFTRCAVRRVYEGLFERPATPADDAALERHHAAFAQGGFRFSALFASVLADPAYRGAGDGVRAPLEAKLVSPEVLQLAVEDLTGFAMRWEALDLMRSDVEGFHVLGGGLDARAGDYPATTSNVSRVLVQSRLAEGGAQWAVQSRGRLVDGVDLEGATFDRLGFTDAFERALSRPPRADELDALGGLFEEVLREDVPASVANAAVLSALLRDPEFLIY